MEGRQKYTQLISKKDEIVINRGKNLCKKCCWSNWTTMSEKQTNRTGRISQEVISSSADFTLPWVTTFKKKCKLGELGRNSQE